METKAGCLGTVAGLPEAIEIICFKDVPIFFLYLLKHFYIKKEVERSIFGWILRKFQNWSTTYWNMSGSLNWQFWNNLNPKKTIKNHKTTKTNPQNRVFFPTYRAQRGQAQRGQAQRGQAQAAPAWPSSAHMQPQTNPARPRLIAINPTQKLSFIIYVSK